MMKASFRHPQDPRVAVGGRKGHVGGRPMIPAAVRVQCPQDWATEIVRRLAPFPNVATDVTAELTGHSARVDSPGHLQPSSPLRWGSLLPGRPAELKIPAAMVGINVEAQKEGFMEATQGKGDGAVTINTYVPGVSYNEFTEPFIETNKNRRNTALYCRNL